jgi:arylsulfatase A-like enzyme
MRMDRREFLGLAGAAALSGQQPAARPNILFILADDLGYGDVGCYGQKEIATPNIDRLAAEGLRFTQAYSGATVCAPSRCCLFTGFHTGHARMRANRTIYLEPEDVTISQLLKKAGYRTAVFGKWSLGELGTAGYPTRKGVDEWFGFLSQTHAHNYYPEHLLHNDRSVLLRGNTGTRKTEYAQDLFTGRALEFLGKQSSTPFFLHLAYTIPHTNNELARDTGNGMEVPSDAPYSNKSWPQPEKNFAAMITRMDADVGKVMQKLKDTGLDQNTIVFFTSDNGPHNAGGHSEKFFRSGGILRGMKGNLYEGGIRVPSIVRWPGQIKPGRTSDYPWAFWDFMPTAAELARIDTPPGIDGISIVPEILGHKQREHPRFYWEHHAGRAFSQAIRSGDWKGVRTGLKGPLELYNLHDDPSEKIDLAKQNSAMVRTLEQALATARTDSKDFPVS